jgi:hypothetical protein
VTFCLFLAKKGILDTSRWIIWWLNAWEQQMEWVSSRHIWKTSIKQKEVVLIWWLLHTKELL